MKACLWDRKINNRPLSIPSTTNTDMPLAPDWEYSASTFCLLKANSAQLEAFK